MESNVLQGNFIQLETNLYKLADLSTLWIIADIYERDISKVENKQKVEITTNIYPNEIFIGQITATGDVLDEKTRTFKIKIDINNVSGKLKPEMFVNISILTNEESILAIPKKAVLTDGENKIVFVSFGKNVFVKREIKLGRETDEIVEIFSGLKTGENVVTEGNFYSNQSY